MCWNAAGTDATTGSRFVPGSVSARWISSPSVMPSSGPWMVSIGGSAVTSVVNSGAAMGSAVPEVRFEVRGAARELFRSRDRELIIAGAAGTGKSNAALMRMHLLCLSNPGIRCLMVRKTAVSLAATTLVTFNKKVAKEALAAGLLRWYGGSPKSPPAFLYANGSEIVVGGMNKPEQIMSAEYDLAFADEATELTLEDWEYIKTRLRNGVLPWQAQWGACNPGAPTHWIKERGNSGQLRLLTSLHRDNPGYFHADGTPTKAGAAYMETLDGLTGVRRSRLLHGQWAAAEGLVYDEWNEGVHLIDHFPVPDEWPRIIAVDFGYTNPMVMQWWATDPDGRMIMFREIYLTGMLVEDMAKLALRQMQDSKGVWKETKPRAVVCDHDAEGRATLAKHLGMSTRAADKRVKIGIDQFKTMLKVSGDGKPRLMVMRDSSVRIDRKLKNARKPTSFVEEITGYVWEDSDKKQDTPVKEGDHALDTARYAVMFLNPPNRGRSKLHAPRGSIR